MITMNTKIMDTIFLKRNKTILINKDKLFHSGINLKNDNLNKLDNIK